jgi:hypothetical protein
MNGHRIAIVQRVYASRAGSPVADILDEYGGVYIGVRFLGLGGGGDASDARVYIPPTEANPNATPDASGGSEVLISMPDRVGGWPVIVGSFHNGQADSRMVKREESVAADAEFPSTNDPADVAIEAGSARIVISKDGDIVLDTSASGKPIRLQLGGELRISRSGDSSEGLLLSGPTLLALGTMIDKYDAIGKRLAAVETALAAALAAGSAAVTDAPVAINGGYIAFAASIAPALSVAPYIGSTKPGDETVSRSATVPAATRGDTLP